MWKSRDLNLRPTIDLGHRIGYAMPEQITVYGIGIIDNCTFSETLSEEVEKAVRVLAARIMETLAERDNASLQHDWQKGTLTRL